MYICFSCLLVQCTVVDAHSHGTIILGNKYYRTVILNPSIHDKLQQLFVDIACADAVLLQHA